MSPAEGEHESRWVTDDSGRGWFEADALRRLVPVFALVIAIVAAVTQPSSAADLAVAGIPPVAFGVWAFVPRVPLVVLTVAVVVPVVVAQRSGDLEPIMLEASLLAFVVGLWSPSLAMSIPLGLLAVAAPGDPVTATLDGEIIMPFEVPGRLLRDDLRAEEWLRTCREAGIAHVNLAEAGKVDAKLNSASAQEPLLDQAGSAPMDEHQPRS
jgi:hypothetical protein